jgi:HEAT repeat protein
MPLLVALGDEDTSARAGAAAGLGRFADARATGPLISALDDEDEHVRARVLSALGEIGDRKAVQFLIASLMFDASETVRHYASDALGELGPVAVVPLLEALDDEDDEARSWIVAALDSIGAPSIERAITESAAGHGLDREHIYEALGWLADEHEVSQDGLTPGQERVAPARG